MVALSPFRVILALRLRGVAYGLLGSFSSNTSTSAGGGVTNGRAGIGDGAGVDTGVGAGCAIWAGAGAGCAIWAGAGAGRNRFTYSLKSTHASMDLNLITNGAFNSNSIGFGGLTRVPREHLMAPRVCPRLGFSAHAFVPSGSSSNVQSRRFNSV